MAAMLWLAGATGGAGADPDQPTSRAAAEQAGPSRYVKLFDFDERRLGNYEDTPMYWTRFAGEGLPNFSNGRFDDRVGHAAPPSFLFTVRGGNIGYEYAHTDLAILPDAAG